MSFGANLHVAQALTDLAIAFRPSEDGYLRDKFFPRKDVSHTTDKIRQISKANLLSLHDLKVGNDGRIPEVQYRLDSDLTYNCVAYGAEAVVGNQDAGNADAALQHEQEQMFTALQSVTTALEYEAVKNTLRSTSVLTNYSTASAGTRWDNYGSATSDPVSDLLYACTQVRSRCGGKEVNRIAMSEMTWNVIAQHPNTLLRCQLTGKPGAVITPAILAGILRVQESAFLITAASYNTGLLGAAAPAFRYFLGSDVIVAHVEEGSTRSYSLGHEFAFSGYGSAPVVVVKYRDERRGGLLGADIIRVGSIVDFKVTQPDAAFLLKTVLDVTSTAYGYGSTNGAWVD